MRSLLAAIVTVLFLADTATAGGNSQAAFALHIAAGNPDPCSVPGLTRNTIWVSDPRLSTPSGPFFFVYLIVCNGSDQAGIAGLETAVQYQGGYSASGGVSPINVFSWHLCADAETPLNGWPAPQGGNVISWLPQNCQRTQSEAGDPNSVTAICGYFYLAAYSESNIFVLPRVDSGQAVVHGCDGRTDNIDAQIPSQLGVAGFGGNSGYNPCISPIIPVRQATWSQIKSRLAE